MSYVDIKNVRDNCDILRVAEWLGLKLNKRFIGEQQRGECPISGGGSRALVLTPSLNRWSCFAPSCKLDRALQNGDCVALVAKVRQLSPRDAALALQSHFLDYSQKKGTANNPLHTIDYLLHEHESVQAMGIPSDVAKHLGIGYAPKGTMTKKVLFPIRDEEGKLTGYIGVAPGADVKLPKQFHVWE